MTKWLSFNNVAKISTLMVNSSTNKYRGNDISYRGSHFYGAVRCLRGVKSDRSSIPLGLFFPCSFKMDNCAPFRKRTCNLNVLTRLQCYFASSRVDSSSARCDKSKTL